MGAAACAQVRSDAVNLTVRNSLISADTSHRLGYTRASPVRDEEAAGSNPATPTQVTGPFLIMRDGPFQFVRRWYAKTAIPRLQDPVVRVGCEVRVPLGAGVVLVTKEGLNVIQRHVVLHEPRRRGVPHDPRRERRMSASATARVPHPVAEVLVRDRAALRRGEYQQVTRPTRHRRRYVPCRQAAAPGG